MVAPPLLAGAEKVTDALVDDRATADPIVGVPGAEVTGALA